AARDDALGDMSPAGIAAGGVEGEARDQPAVADHVGDDGDHRRRHLGEVEARILQLRLEGDRGLADIEDAHSRTELNRPSAPAWAITLTHFETARDCHVA